MERIRELMRHTALGFGAPFGIAGKLFGWECANTGADVIRSLANVQEPVDTGWGREVGHVGRPAVEESRVEEELTHSSSAYYTARSTFESCRRSPLASCTYIRQTAVFIGSGETASSVLLPFSNFMHESKCACTLNYSRTHERLALGLYKTMMPCVTSKPPETIA